MERPVALRDDEAEDEVHPSVSMVRCDTNQGKIAVKPWKLARYSAAPNASPMRGAKLRRAGDEAGERQRIEQGEGEMQQRADGDQARVEFVTRFERREALQIIRRGLPM